mgnify:FL=1
MVEVVVVEEEEEVVEEDSGQKLLDSFYNSFLKTTTSTDDFVKLSLIHSKFKQWFSNQDSDTEVPEKSDMKSFLNKKLGKSKKGGWSNLKLVA